MAVEVKHVTGVLTGTESRRVLWSRETPVNPCGFRGTHIWLRGLVKTTKANSAVRADDEGEDRECISGGGYEE